MAIVEQLVSYLASMGVTLGFSMVSFLFPGVSTPPVTESLLGTTTAHVVSVVDGDTIVVKIPDSSTTTRVRYIGIDTPEPYAKSEPECGSREATARNRELVHNKTVTIVPGVDPYDTYGRLLAYVYTSDVFVNHALITEGYARVMMIEPNIQYRDEFSAALRNARLNYIGIWATCQ